jgi:hypothetical protein
MFNKFRNALPTRSGRPCTHSPALCLTALFRTSATLCSSSTCRQCLEICSRNSSKVVLRDKCVINSRKKELSADCKLTLVKSERHLNGKYKRELCLCSLLPISRGISLGLFSHSIIEFTVSLLVLIGSNRGDTVDFSFRRNQTFL